MNKLIKLSIRLGRTENSIRSFLTYHGISRKGKTVDELASIMLEHELYNTFRRIDKHTFTMAGNDVVFRCRYEADIKRMVIKMYWYFKNEGKILLTSQQKKQIKRMNDIEEEARLNIINSLKEQTK